MGGDDIVVGSGLAALGAVMGLLEAPERRITVLCGPQDGRFAHYDARALAPCAYFGPGGLGTFWHGVIPVGIGVQGDDAARGAFHALFRHFHPRAGIDARRDEPALFVPWRPLRPWPVLQRLAATSAARRLRLVGAPALRVLRESGRVRVVTPAGTFDAQRCWIAAGAIATPALLAHSLGRRVGRETASDHVVCYVGQVSAADPPRVRHTPSGAWFPVLAERAERALYMLRPARFDFRALDAGLERRVVYGSAAGATSRSTVLRLSPGLVSEVLFNRFGLFGDAQRYSVYAQVHVPDAYALADDRAPLPEPAPGPLSPRLAAIRAACDAARAAQPYAELVASRHPESYLPGIHLHDTLDPAAMTAEGLLSSTLGS